ncbi:MAG: hypothetical protein P8164_13910 [Gammaproteobacteria bacterium]|jgi:hypothetical protein
MNSNRSNPPLLDDANAAFIQHHVTINVAARDARNLPAVTRAFGCRVSADRRLVTVFLSTTWANMVLNDLRDNGAIAVVIGRPTTHETLQLKGKVERIAPLSASDRDAMTACRASFVEELNTAGYSRSFAGTVAGEQAGDCLAVTFEPSSVFVQTPGPQAGRRLESRP